MKSTCELNAPHDAGKAAMQQIADWLEKLGMPGLGCWKLIVPDMLAPVGFLDYTFRLVA